MTTVRKSKSGDQLAVGDWLAPDELTDGAAEVLHVLAYRPNDNFREDEKHVHLVVREVGKVAPYVDVVAGGTLFDLASEADLAELREEADRAKRIADIRALADFLEANPSVPAPASVHAQESPNRNGDVWNSGAEGIAEVRRVAEIFGEQVRQDDERTEVVKRFGAFDYTFIAWHKDGRPAEPKPEPLTPAPIAEHYETSAWKGEGPGTCGIECACGVTYDGFDSLAEANQQLSWHIADPTGQDYGRADTAEQDDPTPVSAGRVPPHNGGMTDEGLVDETGDEAR